MIGRKQQASAHGGMVGRATGQCVGQSTKRARNVRAYADEVKANEVTMWGNLQRLQANAPQGRVAAALKANALPSHIQT